MRQIEKNTNLSIYFLCITQNSSTCLIIFLLIRELFIDAYVTQKNHGRLNRSFASSRHVGRGTSAYRLNFILCMANFHSFEVHELLH